MNQQHNPSRHSATRMQNLALLAVMDWSLRPGSAPIRELGVDTARYTPFTDDRAPVEQLIDSLIFDAALGKQ